MPHVYPITIHISLHFLQTFTLSQVEWISQSLILQRPKFRPAVVVKHDGQDAGLIGEITLLGAGEAQEHWGGSQ